MDIAGRTWRTGGACRRNRRGCNLEGPTCLGSLRLGFVNDLPSLHTANEKSVWMRRKEAGSFEIQEGRGRAELTKLLLGGAEANEYVPSV